MLQLPKRPNLPSPDKAFSLIDKATETIDKGLGLINKVADKIDGAMQRSGPAGTKSIESPSILEESPETSIGVSNETTLNYQLDLLLDDLEHLETEHLPEQGRLNGEACDCIAKAARSLRRHSTETIPIASRQGENANIFSEIRDWAQHLIDIGTVNQVLTEKYDAEYLEQAGTASNYRKHIERMTTSGDCPSCEEARESIKQFIEKRKRGREEQA